MNRDWEFELIWKDIKSLLERVDVLEKKQVPTPAAPPDTFWGSGCNCDVEYIGGHFAHCPEKRRG